MRPDYIVELLTFFHYHGGGYVGARTLSVLNYDNAVVLLNMGGPNSLQEVPLFLRNMFSDPCILGVRNGFVRSLVRNVVVGFRLSKSMEMYEKIGGGSPITDITFSLVRRLQEAKPDTFFTYAMRYVPPYSDAVLDEIRHKGIDKITLFSMYPQYSHVTSFSSFRNVLDSLEAMNFEPEIKVVDRYFDNEHYIRSVCNTISRSLYGRNPSDFVLILSAHSIPMSLVDKGDPYSAECEQSRTLISSELQSRGLLFKDVVLSYQSKLGYMRWLGPYTQDVIKRNGKGKIVVYPLSFTIDNSETDYELDILYRQVADSCHVGEYVVCRCLNDSDDFVDLIVRLTQQ